MNIDDMVSIHESETSQVTDKFEEHLLNFHFPGKFCVSSFQPYYNKSKISDLDLNVI